MFMYLGENLWLDGLLSACVASQDVASALSSGNESNETDSTHSISELSASAAGTVLCLHSHNSHCIISCKSNMILRWHKSAAIAYNYLVLLIIIRCYDTDGVGNNNENSSIFSLIQMH